MEAKSLILKYTKDYLLLIDEEAEIYQMDLYLDVDCDTVTRATLTSDQYSGCKKIIAYYPLTEEARELDLPLLPNPFEEKPLMEQASKLRELRGYHKDNHYSFCGGFIEGYRAAQSKQFSLEDMKKAIEMARELTSFGTKYLTEEIIDVISAQKLPKEFVPEAVTVTKGTNEFDFYEEDVIKTITNSNGKEELVGVYKY